MSGTKSRNKGASYEREIVNELKSHGIKAERVPLSGAMKGNYGGDLKIGPNLALIAECKRRKKAFSGIYKALEQDDADMLFCRDDNQKSFVVIPIEQFISFGKWLGWDK